MNIDNESPNVIGWRGYVFSKHVDPENGDCWLVHDEWKPIATVHTLEEAKEQAREHARRALAEAQAKFDRVSQPE